MLNKVLVLTEGYPSLENIYNMSFVHSRNIQYLKQGIEVDVISFSANENYSFENINVYTQKEKINPLHYDAVLSHAPNIRNHFRFLVRNYCRIKKIVLFFHGHEILITERYYPTPYAWQRNASRLEAKLRKSYDHFKVLLLRNLLYRKKVASIFVSEWMLTAGLENLKAREEHEISFSIINNAINHAFYNKNYNFDVFNKKADFITIRPLDGRKYAVDKVVELAENNPEFTFHIYGKGEFFKYNAKPDNVTVFDMFIEQKNIPELLNHYEAAIMPTRLDAQGVMMCEMASYGIPMLISDLPVCREMLNGFSNCVFIDNESFNQIKLSDVILTPLMDFSITKKFSPELLAKKELEFIFDSHSKNK